MGVLGKLKSILFDEEEVDVVVGEDELPERQAKPKEEPKKGVIEYHNGDLEEETKEKDTIKEIKIPEDEPEELEEPKKPFKFDIDVDAEIPMRTRSHEVIEEEPKHDAIKDIIEERDRRIEAEMEKRKTSVEIRTNINKNEPKDYKKLLEEPINKTKDKKAFKVTPVISPVFGIIEGELSLPTVPKEEVEKSVVAPKRNMPRDFGPVSYNDAPLPVKTTKITKDIVEMNSTINDIITGEETPAVVKTTTIVEETEIMLPETKEEVVVEEFPDVSTSGIENDYINTKVEEAFETTQEYDEIVENDEHIPEEIEEEYISEEIEEDEYIPGYEDDSVFEEEPKLERSYISEYDEDFEATAPINLEELDSVTKAIKKIVDKDETAEQIEEEIEEEVEETEEVTSEDIIDEYDDDFTQEIEKPKVASKKKEEDDDEKLDETIETDLFNLIDSMYRSDDDEEEEEE